MNQQLNRCSSVASTNQGNQILIYLQMQLRSLPNQVDQIVETAQGTTYLIVMELDQI